MTRTKLIGSPREDCSMTGLNEVSAVDRAVRTALAGAFLFVVLCYFQPIAIKPSHQIFGIFGGLSAALFLLAFQSYRKGRIYLAWILVSSVPVVICLGYVFVRNIMTGKP